MFKQLQRFLGVQRLWTLFFLLAATGLANLILNATDAAWVPDAQMALVLIFLVGSLLVVGSALEPYERGKWAGIVAPALLAIGIGLFIAPDLLPILSGGALGWIAAGYFLFRARGPMEYQRAIKHMRKHEYEQAVNVLDALIKDEPDQSRHYRFRAELLRLSGKLDRARRDYEKMTQVARDDTARAVAYNGLAEVLLQSGKFDAAHDAAQKAFDFAPDEWVAAYNLGMIEDRLRQSTEAIQHLDQALAAKVPDARHRLLIHLYRARAYVRLGDMAAAEAAADAIKRHRGGLNEWQVLLQSDQAQALRDVLQDDIRAAEAIADDELDLSTLADG